MEVGVKAKGWDQPQSIIAEMNAYFQDRATQEPRGMAENRTDRYIISLLCSDDRCWIEFK